MNKEKFWEIIKTAKQKAQPQYGQYDMESEVFEQLILLSPEEILEWAGILHELTGLLYNKKIFKVFNKMTEVPDGYDSVEYFEYFRLWIISKGKDIYEKALKKPRSIFRIKTNGKEHFVFEPLLYTAGDAYDKICGEGAHDAWLDKLSASTKQ